MATNDDSRVSCRYWLWQAYRRLGRAAEARAVAEGARREGDVMENGSYQRLLALFAGDATPEALLPQGVTGGTLDAATMGYGIGAWHRAEGRDGEAARWWRAVLALEGQRNAFGYLAAEAELSRLAR